MPWSRAISEFSKITISTGKSFLENTRRASAESILTIKSDKSYSISNREILKSLQPSAAEDTKFKNRDFLSRYEKNFRTASGYQTPKTFMLNKTKSYNDAYDQDFIDLIQLSIGCIF